MLITKISNNKEIIIDISYQYIDGNGDYPIERQHTW